MSYILDALKKADQEREQGQVPGLLAQQTLGADAPKASTGLSPLVWAGVGVALTLAGVLTWMNWPVASTPAANTGRWPVDQPLPGQAPASPGPNANTAAMASDRSSLARHVDAPPPSTDGHGTLPPTLHVPGAPAGDRAPDRRTPTQTPVTALSARPPAGAMARLADLPDAVRKDLPVLNVGGAMHSPTPAQRMLVLNGQVFHEGDSPHPGLVLEEIRLKSAVLNFQGQRFELTY